MAEDYSNIFKKLPYTKPFLFVEKLVEINEDGVIGFYTLTEDHEFFQGHFVGYPVTPGVILTEIMAQIGVVCLGIYILGDLLTKDSKIAMTETNVQFLKPVFPNEKVTVISNKQYFRFGKLKCKVSMSNEAGEEVCRGVISGVIKL
ncbi:3-hydroxyacyl-ACP dehydratase FabZ family protein [Sungkyunkwania multivorans]|uniref:3-hydroxyacyl-ACP dehydratase FabZ family protein n=1 Tax=Sungkyunkwania multivorans TaxID=1173618 RepID=A0ABW3CZQ9_9FLAO